MLVVRCMVLKSRGNDWDVVMLLKVMQSLDDGGDGAGIPPEPLS